MFFFVSSPLKGEVSLFFEIFYCCRLVAYPIIISLFTFTVPSFSMRSFLLCFNQEHLFQTT
jgi:hypothetical protein